jgi:hypothetical protein
VVVRVAVTRKHKYTFDNFFEWVPGSRDLIEFIYYEDLLAPIDPERRDPVIFADLDRLNGKQFADAIRLADRLLLAGQLVLNHPAKFVDRFSLLKRLNLAGLNQFRVFRVPKVLFERDVRYPVFLRKNSGHSGNMTELAVNRWALSRQVLRQIIKAAVGRVTLSDLIAVEYHSVRQAEGYSAKYSYLKIGPSLIARHVLFSKRWVVKYPDLQEGGMLRREQEFLDSQPHFKLVHSLFELSGIDYGRIDFSIDPNTGGIQVWEINTNPTLASRRETTAVERRPSQQSVLEQAHRAFLDLNSVRA